jgi:hypothetical protein
MPARLRSRSLLLDLWCRYGPEGRFCVTTKGYLEMAHWGELERLAGPIKCAVYASVN